MSIPDMPRRADPDATLPTVAVLVLPDVVPFDLVIPEYVFGSTKPHRGRAYYRVLVCGPAPGPVAMTGGLPIGVPLGVEALREADTIVIPGRAPADGPVPEEVL